MKHAALFLLTFCVSTLFGQGVLNPPGPPAPTMKTLDQVEPRIPVPGGGGLTIINEAGSYYLTTNLFQTLTITADNVSLDLSGYTISSGGQRGIDVAPGVNNLTIRNGMIVDNDIGIYAPNTERGMNVFRNLTVCENVTGILAGPGILVEECHVEANSMYGIRMEWCSGSVVRRCRVSRNEQCGIAVLSGGGLVEDNLIEGNVTVGLQVLGEKSVVRNNVVKGNVRNYRFIPGNQLELLISEVPEALEWPCSAKFTGTLICPLPGTNGVTITSSDVTLDLAGHSLVYHGEPGLGSGVYVASGAQRVSVKNGGIQGWAGQNSAGITGEGSDTYIDNIRSHRNFFGFQLGEGVHIERCSAVQNSDMGFNLGGDTRIYQSFASRNGVNGINTGDSSRIKDCVAVKNAHDGIMTGRSCLIDGCNAVSNSFDGIFSGDSCRIQNCLSESNNEDGIEVYNQCTVSQCTISNNGRTGINVLGTMTTLDLNTVTLCGMNAGYPGGSRAGILVNPSLMNNLIIRNRLSSNLPVDFNIGVGNQIGTVIAPPLPTTPGVNGSAGGGFGATDPFANVVY